MKITRLVVALAFAVMFAPSLFAHTVSITCNPATTQPAGVTVQGYNFFRSEVGGGPYQKINGSTPVSTCAYTDATVQDGHRYYYVATTVSTDNVNSVNSNQAAVTIPVTAPNPPTQLRLTVQNQ